MRHRLLLFITPLAGAAAQYAVLLIPGLVFLLWDRSALQVTPLRAEVTASEDGITRFRPNMRAKRYLHGREHAGARYPTILVTTNAEGFRDRDHAIAKPPGTLRAAFVGDSFVFGTNLEEHQTITKRVEHALASPAYEVFNFGLPGLNTTGMAQVAETFASKYRPDVVVYSFICDDLSETDVITHTAWSRRADQLLDFLPPEQRHAFSDSLVRYKEFRYSLDYRIFSAFSELYGERLRALLRHVEGIARRRGYDVLITSYCGQPAALRTFDAYGRHEAKVLKVLHFNPPLDETKHPTPAAIDEIARAVAKELRALAARRAMPGLP